jgi:hypothetical protein
LPKRRDLPSLPGLAVGTLEAVGRAPDTLRLAGLTYQVAHPTLLNGLAARMRIAVGWDLV